MKRPIITAEATKLRDELALVADGAWCMVPALPEQAQALWSCVWGDDWVLGSTLMTPPTRARLQHLATASDCWWTWDMSGQPHWMSLNEARMAYNIPRPAIDGPTAMAVLQTLREMVGAEYWPAIDYAIGRLGE